MKKPSYQVFTAPPQDFSANMHAAGCYLVVDKRILILQRHQEKFQGSTWGVPGGKLEQGEKPVDAVKREVAEEVGIDISQEKMNYLGQLFIRLTEVDYIFEIFSCHLSKEPQVFLELNEHTAYGWFSIEQAKQLNLIQGGLEALEFFLEKSRFYEVSSVNPKA